MSHAIVPRGLDHIVHAVRDLDAAADFYSRLGFTVGARNRHPWGTHNHVVQLAAHCFVELLTLAEPDKLGRDGISTQFGRFNHDFIARHDGLSLLILNSTDARADAAAFAAAGIAASEALTFERAATRPDGTPVKVGFSLAFARDPQPADIGFAVCQHHFPENFWDAKFQDHRNTAAGIKGAVLTAENPSDHHIFLSALVGERDLQATSMGLTVPTPRGEIQVMDATAFRSQFGDAPPDAGPGTRLAAIRFGVSDMAAARAALAQGGIPTAERNGRLVVGPAAAFGATLAFELV
jgi:catechol 2,3-dioxygenase-like lactoylglutathione lyase family enzyme